MAINKALLDSIQERLSKEAEAARKAENDDPITRELQTLADIAEQDFARVEKPRAQSATEDEQILQKKKVVAESRLAVLRRKEELSMRSAGPEFVKLKEQLVAEEQEVVMLEAEINDARNTLKKLELEAAQLNNMLTEASPLYEKAGTLSTQITLQEEMAKGFQPTTILYGPSLVVEDMPSPAGSQRRP